MNNPKKEQRRFKLLMKYYEFTDEKKRNDWFKSLPLEDRNILRQNIKPSTNSLF